MDGIRKFRKFVDYSLINERNAIELTKDIPLIYTTYPQSHPSGLICKSDGENNDVLYDQKILLQLFSIKRIRDSICFRSRCLTAIFKIYSKKIPPVG